MIPCNYFIRGGLAEGFGLLLLDERRAISRAWSRLLAAFWQFPISQPPSLAQGGVRDTIQSRLLAAFWQCLRFLHSFTTVPTG